MNSKGVQNKIARYGIAIVLVGNVVYVRLEQEDEAGGHSSEKGKRDSDVLVSRSSSSQAAA